MVRLLRNAFLSGIFLLLPLGVTVMIVNFLIQKVGAPSSKLFFGFMETGLRDKFWFEILLNSVSTLIIVVLITLLGILSNYFLGKLTVRITERIISKVPFISTVYNTVKQIVNTFSEQKKAVFQQVVLVNYPQKGTYALGFLTGTARGEVQDLTGESVVNVFVPTTPNPTSGFLLMVPKEEVIYLSMSIADGMKLIISGGAVIPTQTLPKEITAKDKPTQAS